MSDCQRRSSQKVMGSPTVALDYHSLGLDSHVSLISMLENGSQIQRGILILDDAQHSRRFFISQKRKHLIAHRQRFAAWNGQELIFLGAHRAPDEEQAMDLAHFA